MLPQAYRHDPQQPLGRQSAGAGFLEAYLRYSRNRYHHIVVKERTHGEWFHAEAYRYNQNSQTLLTGLGQWGDSPTTTGAIALPGPGLDEWAWKRMPWGDASFSLVGLVHTLCSRSVQWGLGQFATAPVRPWDALICTSHAARKVVEGFLDRQDMWLTKQVGATRFQRPQLPVIPLGVHREMWAPPGGKAVAMAAARHQLKIPQDALVVLVAGRLDVLTKFQPGPLLRALADLQSAQLPQLQLLIYGEAPNAPMEQLWRAGVADAAPQLPVHWVPGRQLELAGPVRWAADLFVSLADNPQETFGITPLEAMAAELPCLVSDWDGYRDTVDHSVGARIPTCMVEGLGEEQSLGLLSETLSYDHAVGQLSQGVAIDPKALRAQLLKLLSNQERLRALGEVASRHVDQLYAWPVVMESWRHLLHELQERRHSAIAAGDCDPPGLPYWLPNCSTGFGTFPTKVLNRDQLNQHTISIDIAKELLEGPLDSWDSNLHKEFSNLNGGQALDTLSARAVGWLLKQGLVPF